MAKREWLRTFDKQEIVTCYICKNGLCFIFPCDHFFTNDGCIGHEEIGHRDRGWILNDRGSRFVVEASHCHAYSIKRQEEFFICLNCKDKNDLTLIMAKIHKKLNSEVIESIEHSQKRLDGQLQLLVEEIRLGKEAIRKLSIDE